ncbi:MAG: methyltransferase domain-containing protein [Gammaproteobacteria bacterium]
MNAAIDKRIDKRQVRRAFSRAAANGRPPPVAVVAQRLLSRLDEITITPEVMADIGGGGCPALAEKYADAKMLAVDFALPVLRFDDGGGREVWRVLADAEKLPLADGSVDLAYSNLCLEWTDAGAALSEAARVLRPGGVFVFSTLGPDTLREMRAAFDGRVHLFADMHDIGDMLAPRGFSEPVMQREEIRLTYSHPEDAAREVHQWGGGFTDAKRRRGLGGKSRWQKCLSAYPREEEDGRYAATFEIIYALAWRAESGGGAKPVRFFPRSVYNAKL